MGGHFDLENKNIKINSLEHELNKDGIWNDIDYANKINNELVNLKKSVENYNVINNKIEDSLTLLEILTDSDLEELKEIENEITNIEKELTELEIETLFTGAYDNSNCFLEIHPGAGGTEACDWAFMLSRMYQRWAERHGYKTEVLSQAKKQKKHSTTQLKECKKTTTRKNQMLKNKKKNKKNNLKKT